MRPPQLTQHGGRSSTLLAPLVSLLLVLPACTKGPAPAGAPSCAGLDWSGPRPGTNLLLIVNDTMRRDRVSAYGGPARTPAFDSFARENILFMRAFTQAPWTKPSMATLFTSLYPSQHGVLLHPQDARRFGETPNPQQGRLDVLTEEFTTLAEVLRDAGYRTAAIVSNPWMERRFGFAQGFELYDDSLAAWDAPGEEVTRRGLEWLESIAADEPFFLYLHYMDSHRPYALLNRWDIVDAANRLFDESVRPDPSIARLIADLVWLEEGMPAADAGIDPSVALLQLAYDHGIEAFDGALSVLLEQLRRHAAFDRTAVIVTSDHGESLYDRGFGNHGDGLYDDEVAIPLAARLPGVAARGDAINCPVGLIDLEPTLCTLLDVECPSPVFGRSLLTARRGSARPGDGYLVIEGVRDRPENRAVRGERYKLLWQPLPAPDGEAHMLFDIAVDPRETRNLLTRDRRTAETERIVQRLVSAAREVVSPLGVANKQYVPLDPDLEERLRSLGYIE